ncbi:MAG: alpha/beta hydrolase [Bradyrhizobiaceae bacterium]|nr:alpha/beta hydrolase [Bradyrhizobiaceae bacterium]
MSFVHAGRRIDYAETGAGPCLVLVPGSFSTTAAWRPVTEFLKDRFRVVATSLPGAGETEETRQPYDESIDRVVETVEAVAACTGGPVHLAGHSWGGTVAICAAMRGRVPVASLTLLDANPCDLLRLCGEDSLYDEVRRMSEDYFRAFRAGEREAARHVIDFWTGAGSFDRLPAKIRDYAVLTTPANVRDWPAMFGFRPALSDYAALDLPVLVVSGSESHPALQRTADIIAETVPGARRVTVAGASHFLISTHATEVAALMAEHVAAAEARPAA